MIDDEARSRPPSLPRAAASSKPMRATTPSSKGGRLQARPRRTRSRGLVGRSPPSRLHARRGTASRRAASGSRRPAAPRLASWSAASASKLLSRPKRATPSAARRRARPRGAESGADAIDAPHSPGHARGAGGAAPRAWPLVGALLGTPACPSEARLRLPAPRRFLEPQPRWPRARAAAARGQGLRRRGRRARARQRRGAAPEAAARPPRRQAAPAMSARPEDSSYDVARALRAAAVAEPSPARAAGVARSPKPRRHFSKWPAAMACRRAPDIGTADRDRTGVLAVWPPFAVRGPRRRLRRLVRRGAPRRPPRKLDLALRAALARPEQRPRWARRLRDARGGSARSSSRSRPRRRAPRRHPAATSADASPPPPPPPPPPRRPAARAAVFEPRRPGNRRLRRVGSAPGSASSRCATSSGRCAGRAAVAGGRRRAYRLRRPRASRRRGRRADRAERRPRALARARACRRPASTGRSGMTEMAPAAAVPAARRARERTSPSPRSDLLMLAAPRRAGCAPRPRARARARGEVDVPRARARATRPRRGGAGHRVRADDSAFIAGLRHRALRRRARAAARRRRAAGTGRGPRRAGPQLVGTRSALGWAAADGLRGWRRGWPRRALPAAPETAAPARADAKRAAMAGGSPASPARRRGGVHFAAPSPRCRRWPRARALQLRANGTAPTVRHPVRARAPPLSEAVPDRGRGADWRRRRRQRPEHLGLDTAAVRSTRSRRRPRCPRLRAGAVGAVGRARVHRGC